MLPTFIFSYFFVTWNVLLSGRIAIGFAWRCATFGLIDFPLPVVRVRRHLAHCELLCCDLVEIEDV